MHVKLAELPVTDQNRAVAFYTEVLGGAVVKDMPYGDEGWRWIEIAFPGGQTRLLLTRRANSEPSTQPSLVLVEKDVRSATESLRSRGAEIIAEPLEAPWEPGTVFAEFRDSEGNRIVIGSA